MLDRLKTDADWRTLLTYLGSWGVGITYSYIWSQTNEDFNILGGLYVLAFFVAPILNHLRSLPARLLARAFWLQTTLLYVLVGGYALYQSWEHLDFDAVTFASIGSEHLAGFTIWAGPIVALLAAGVRGLDLKTPTFVPVKFRKTMLASLMLGTADLIALTIYGTIELVVVPGGPLEPGLLLTGCAAVMGVALFGLFRLRFWGLLLCIVGNLIVAGLALSGALALPGLLAGALVATAALQLLIPIPMVREIASGLRRGRLPAEG